ncbi:MAG: multicopper polyphenol oxidase [Desulfococcus sp. 4484_241]|nr:MAG: multicopper polyphenol oxidase [Desulfococcus sp. 4484_241]
MLKTIHNGLAIFRFANLSRQPGLDHAVFTRNGGFSLPPFASLNVGENTGDRPEAIRKNRQMVAGYFEGRPLVFVKQVHGKNLLVMDGTDTAASGEIKEADAMISAVPGPMLCIKLADCQSVMLYDHIKRVAANIHSGWRGSVANIIGTTVRTMTDKFGCLPSNMLAAISPSLGPCCAEFKNYEKELPEAFWKYKDGKNRFDFWQISKKQLTDAGVPEANIETAGICTSCNTDFFFSYRKEGITGRFVTAIGMAT